MLVNQALCDLFIAHRVEKRNHQDGRTLKMYLFQKGPEVSGKVRHYKITPAASSEISLACEWQTWRQLTT